MSDIISIENFIQTNSPDGGFLQSKEWRKFQESVGLKTFNVSSSQELSSWNSKSLALGGFWANIIEHELPVVGKYFYIPRGPITEGQKSKIKNKNDNAKSKNYLNELIKLAKRNNAGWIRFDANNLNILDTIFKNFQIKKAPHDMQPRELFIIDITKPGEELLAGMKSKTRYNVKLAQKHGVKIFETRDLELATQKKYIEKFIKLIKITAKRDKITPHPDGYYYKMFETIPAEYIKLYIAEYENKVVAANINVFYGKVATYMHGASDNNCRNVMAPYLLQWQAILDAKAAGCERYDLGGVRSSGPTTLDWNSLKWSDHYDPWQGITRFKTGFSIDTKPIKFPGSYDMVINTFRYNLYRILQRIKALF